mmetsp:Transcript_18598/g.46635  ORF Transcript_18598/g.46635 Transcript_18598/m.46635 type:complete len:298 (+) Transcript_18598:1467-2360(+)
MSASTSARRAASGRSAILSYTSARPLLGLTLRRAKRSACFSKTSLKKTVTMWPNMMGSETFIMVALRCTEKRTPLALASSISAATKSRSFATSRRAASMTSPSWSSTRGLRTVTAPSSATISMRTAPAAGTTWESSPPKKSPAAMDATWDLLAGSHLPSQCGWRCANALTTGATRRSELPSLRTGFTALPSTPPNLAMTSLSRCASAHSGTAPTPFALSSSTHTTSCGTLALTFGSFTSLAPSPFTMAPSPLSTSGVRPGCFGSGNAAASRAASEISAVSTATPSGGRKRRSTGRRA